MTIRCSKLARIMVCSGILYIKDLPEEPTNPAAEEGTAAGEYLERLLLNQNLPEQAKNGIYFDTDMKFYLPFIANEILDTRESDVLCEQRIDWVTRSGIKIRGQYDASFVRNGNLYIDDLKYGWGIVEVKENWQLLGYAIGEVIRRGQVFPKIILRIHQPRPHHEDGNTRTWELTYEELIEYKEKIETRMTQIKSGDKTFNTGPSCKYCPGSAEACTAFNRLFYRALEVSTEFTQDSIDETELARQLDHVARAGEVIKIKKDSLEQLAVSRIKENKLIPGYMTEKSYGNRSWNKNINPKAIEVLTNIKITEPVMLSPAKAEKAGVPKDLVKAYTSRFFKGEKLVKKDSTKVGNEIFGTAKPEIKGVS